MSREQTIEEMIAFGMQYLGTPYVYGAPTDGEHQTFDCSSFVQHLFAHVGIELPRSSILQAKDPQGKEISIQDIGKGDVLFMRSDKGYYDDGAFSGRELYIGHVGIYCGEQLFLHAKSSLGGVVLQSLPELQKDPHYAISVAKRFI